MRHPQKLGQRFARLLGVVALFAAVIPGVHAAEPQLSAIPEPGRCHHGTAKSL